MTTQPEMFPKTTLDVLAELEVVHRADLEKARKALAALSDDEKIARAYEKAEDRVDVAVRLLRDIKAAVERERKRLTQMPIASPATLDAIAAEVASGVADIINSGAMDTEGLTATATVSHGSFTDEVAAELDRAGVEYQRDQPLPDVDPITGEVVTYINERGDPIAISAGFERTCQQCGGEGRLPDRTGGGHHKCRACEGTGKILVANATPVVVVLYPGDDEPHVTEVGPLTRYSELVADYLAAAGIDEDVNVDEWQVLAERELTAEKGGRRTIDGIIWNEDYGHRIIVAAADQGSVTGMPAESELVEAESR